MHKQLVQKVENGPTLMVQYQNWGIQEWENNVQARIRKAGHGMQTGPVVNGGSHAIIDERADSRKGLGRPIRLSRELPEEGKEAHDSNGWNEGSPFPFTLRENCKK